MKGTPVKADQKVLSAAFDLVFRQGRSPPSCPDPDESDLLNRIRDKVPEATAAACREALIRVRRLSIDVYDECDAFREGIYGSGDEAKDSAIMALAEKNPGFTIEEYRKAFVVGMMWTAF
ncbi:MAG: hypothetical protein LUQ01_00005 [Methanolinea sp.]|nr:hypothetical protein [Methanolinea sp.]